MKVFIIVNGKRALRGEVKLVVDQLQSSPELDVFIKITRKTKEAIILAQNAAEIADIIVSVGGDGTNNEVLNGVLKSQNPEVPIALFPNGTGNDFIKMIPDFRSENVVRAIKNQTVKKIDCGIIMTEKSHTYFLNIADIGFGAEVVRIMDEQRKKRIGGKLSYAIAIIRAFFGFKKPSVRISYKDVIIESKILMAVFANGSFFGHGIGIYPEASLTSGKLGLTVIGDINLITYLKYLKRLKLAKKIEHPEVQYSSFESLKIQLLRGKTYAEADGEMIRENTIEVRVLPQKVNLIWPQ